VRVLTDHAGVSQPAVSKQLGILKLAGLVSGRRDGRQTHCRAEPQALEAVDRLDEPLPRVLARPGSSARKIC
jgi:DNA-binding transcriptional ArsR family regulator